MAGETNLKKLVRAMRPEMNLGAYVFITQSSIDHIPTNDILGQFREKEGITIIIEKEKADMLNLPYEFVASWITLRIHSSLDSVGLTAIFSSELAKNNVGCNVVAGYYHDHVFVNKKDGKNAMKILQKLSKNYE